jgi:hypothetical protein
MNNNIEEKLVSFEAAKLLKGKGFDAYCSFFYMKPNSKVFGIDEHGRNYLIKNVKNKLYVIGEYVALNRKNVFLAPTQQLAIDWVFVNFDIYITSKIIKWNYEKDTIRYNYNICKLNPNNPSDIIDVGYNFDTPEEAKEAAIIYCLENLIK